MEEQIPNHEGGCLCGAVRYRVIGGSDLTGVCHCRYCQLRTASAFAVLVYFSHENFELLSGSLGYKNYFKITNEEQLSDFFKNTLNSIKGPVFIEILIDSSSRQDLGRPKETPLQQKEKFTKLLKNQKGEEIN